ncbi:WGR domain-containing protein [Luteolibacter arcticus]|uniref:WGR domain-containing protein n=1 Tax=Luteolibacter arcticus TaxID=1581411 RepID=A0ABT3GF53_9BACT|nr:WGR domain-containing protein [Luteolibacter arcticus]MCW1922230.1 WGR domain-containing protein [Luteolibacter arcticus]
MKLVRQSRLHFREGNSDKVYEVDLCEAGEGEFLVNFRYGRRGAALRDGTKTPFPESRAKAEAIFEALVAEKTQKGYKIAGESGLPAALPVAASPALACDDPRRTAILRRLKEEAGGSPKGKARWKLSRVLWRAGAWMMREAADDIATIGARLQGPMDLWCAAWALGRCGSPKHAVVLDLMTKRAADVPWVLAMIAEAKVALLPEEDDSAAGLPPTVAAVFLTGDPAAFRAVVEQELRTGQHNGLPSALMILSSRHGWVREVMHELVRLLPLGRGTMPFFRQVLKASEFRLDAELYGQCVRRFDTTNATGAMPWRLPKAAPQPAYTTGTRNYLRRRPVRLLTVAGESGEAALFIPLATGLLLAYDDQTDQPRETSTSTYDWDRTTRRSIERKIWYPRYSSCFGFIWLMRGAGGKLEPTNSKVTWRFIDGKRGDATTREEPFAHLWDQAPDAVMHLLRHARTREVQQFALRVWRANPAFVEEADASFVADLLGSWFADTVALGLEIARARWNPAAPELPLLLAMLDSSLPEARTQGIAWLRDVATIVVADSAFLASTAFLKHEDARLAVRDVLRATAIPVESRRDLVARVVSALLALDDDEAAIAGPAVDFLLLLAPAEVQALPPAHLAELAAHPLEACQLLAVQVLLKSSSPAGLPESLLLAAVSSDFPAVRRLGMELLGKLSDHELASRTEVLAACAVSKHEELRDGAAPLLGRVATRDRTSARELVLQWYPLLFREESFEGLHASVHALLTESFANELDAIPADSFRRMLESRYDYGQMLGFALLQRESGPFETEDLVAWAVHPLVAVREWAIEQLEREPDLLRREPGLVLRLLESPYDDGRERAFDFCRREIRDGDWTPESLVAVCDSNHRPARDFGRELVTRLFREEDGPVYLLRFSQHPATEIQLFATNYLERHASGSAERIAALDLYFRTVLSRIGVGRVAKQRVLAFLEKEALADESIARLVVPLLARQSGTVAIQDKAEMIRILDALRRHWPQMESPLKPRPVPVREPS